MSLHNGRYFVFTWNNPNLDPDDFHASFAGTGDSFLIFQREKGENGTEHYQGYVEFSRNKGISQLKSLNSQIHWENRRGTQAQAIDYSGKEDTRVDGPWQYGEPKKLNNTGVSPDFLVTVKQAKRLRDVYDSHPDDMRKYPRFAETVRSLYPPPPEDKAPEVILLIGPPGTGKTRYVRSREEREDLYVKPCDRDFWMNGYDGHPAVLLDDFAGASNHVTLTNLLQLIDRYQISVSTKHGHAWWQPERIYITTNIHPSNWYGYEDRMIHYKALQRRFTQVVIFDGIYLPGHQELPNVLRKDQLVDQVFWDEFWQYDKHHLHREVPLN